MIHMKAKIFSGWNWSRGLRFGIGLLIIIQGIRAHETMSVIFGALFCLLPLFNLGCCAGGSCTIRENNSRSVHTDSNITEKAQ